MKNARIFTSSWGQLEGAGSNLGDIIIFEAVSSIVGAIPSAELYCFSGDEEYTRRKYGAFTQNPFTVSGALKTILNMGKADLVLLGGGELVQTRSSFVYLLVNLAPALVALAFRKRCAAIGVGIADRDETSSLGRFIARNILNRTDLICVRDGTSFFNALDCGIEEEKLMVTGDLAFQFAMDNEGEEAGSCGEKVLFCPRYTGNRKGGLFPSRPLVGRSNDGSKEFKRSVKIYADMLNAISAEFDVIMMPCYLGKDFKQKDAEFVREVVNAAGNPPNVDLFMEAMSMESLKSLARETFVAVGVPLHSLILSSLMGNPPISLSYASKCRNFMEEIGCEEFAADVSKGPESVDLSSLMSLIRTCRENYAELSAKMRAHVRRLSENNSRHLKIIRSFLEN